MGAIVVSPYVNPGVDHTLLEHASIMGKEFWPTALAELASEPPSGALNTKLRELVRKQLIEPARFDEGIRDLYRTAEDDGVFCYTFFKGVGAKR